MSTRTSIITGLLCLVPLSVAVAGCDEQPPHVDRTKMTVEQKIKSVENSDMPAPMKQKALAELQAKQGQGG